MPSSLTTAVGWVAIGAAAAGFLALLLAVAFFVQIRRVREGQKEGDPVWTVGRVTLWPNGFYLGNHFEWRVPIDDENTLSVCWFFMRVPKGREPYVQDKVPTWVSPIKDDSGRWNKSLTMLRREQEDLSKNASPPKVPQPRKTAQAVPRLSR